MSEIYKNNLKIIETSNPDIRKNLSRPLTNIKLKFINTPYPNIIINNRFIHSRLNPFIEAERLIKNINIKKIKETVFLFLGMGVGYHIKLFIEKYGNLVDKNQLVVIEKDPEIFKLVAENIDISFLKNTKLFVGENLSTLKSYFNSLEPIKLGGYRIIKLRGDIINFPDYYLKIEEIFKDIVSSKVSDVLTRFSFETLWMRNIIENISNLSYSSPINSLHGQGVGSTAIVIGAGPSVYYQMDTIKKLQNNAVLIAVDTVLSSLLSYDILPEIIVTLDGQFHSLFDFSKLFSTSGLIKPILVYDLLSYPKIVRRFKPNTFFTGSLNLYKDNRGNYIQVDNPFVSYIKSKLLPFNSLPCGGSVITTAIELALYMNFSKIIVVGADFSYVQFKTHVNSSPMYNLFLEKSNRLSTLNTKNIDTISKRNLFEVPGIKSNRVYTDFTLVNYKNWIENQNHYKNTVINSTKDGLPISNIRYLNLENLIKILHKDKKPNIKYVSKGVDRDLLLKFLYEMRRDLKSLTEEIQNKRFTTDFVIHKFPYFYNIIIEARKLFKEEKKIEKYFYGLVNFLQKVVNKSITRLKS